MSQIVITRRSWLHRLEDGLHHFRVRQTSPYIGKTRADVDLKNYAGLSLVGLLEADNRTPLQRPQTREGDLVLVRGDAVTAGRFAADMHLAVRERAASAPPIADALVSRSSGLAEAVISSRSKLIGQVVFPGMTTEDGGLMVLAIQRGGDEMRQEPVQVQAGDHLLLQGTWKALDQVPCRAARVGF
jgi:uncharacterized protein with PhoU and TrkA domain